MPKTFLVSNRLPVRIDAAGRVERTTGGLASALAGAGVEATWVGWPGVALEDLADVDGARATLEALDVAPVLLTRAELDGYYEGYANATLWPLLHAMVPRAVFQSPWFEAYERVNRRFAEVVLSRAAPGDRVWVHDFHLFLLPALLREARRGLSVGFFLHTPFPSSETFRALPEREAVLSGLLGAQLIGFHTYGDLRHFRSALLRVLGVESEVEGVRLRDHVARLAVLPIGHDQAGFSAAIRSDEYRRALAAHRAGLAGRRLVLSVERLDYTKGIPQRLAAIRSFLQRFAALQDEAVFVLVAVPSRTGIREYDALTEDVQREVGALNGQFGAVGRVPVQFLHQTFPMPELAALYALADVCVVTPLVDGMNLVAKEFVACKAEAPDARPGALVLSEFAGAARELSEALLVNPYDVEATARAIAEALELSDDERRRRVDAMAPWLARHDAPAWAARFLEALDASAADVAAPRDATSALDALASGLASRAREGARVALYLDYDGTLRDFTPDPAAAVPDEALRALLRGLARRLDVTIVSGRTADFLDRHLAALGVGLVAEHGYLIRRAGSPTWEEAVQHLDRAWKDSLRPVLQGAVDLTPGATLEEKQASLVWHHRRADPEYGAWRALGLLAELTAATANLPVVVHHGNEIVEVSSQEVSKGAAVRRLVGEQAPDIVLIAGDDRTDETMLSVELAPPTELHSVVVGTRPSRATHRTDIGGLRALLRALLDSLARP